MRLTICPLASFAEVAAETRATHALRFTAPGEAMPPAAEGIAQEMLRFHDIADPRDGFVAPGEAHIAAIVAMGRRLGRADHLLVQCLAGVSRSSAAALIVLAARHPALPAAHLAETLRARSPVATPNPLMIALADAMLGREGRLVAAVRGIGRGADYAPYRCFAMPDFDENPAEREG